MLRGVFEGRGLGPQVGIRSPLSVIHLSARRSKGPRGIGCLRKRSGRWKRRERGPAGNGRSGAVGEGRDGRLGIRTSSRRCHICLVVCSVQGAPGVRSGRPESGSDTSRCQSAATRPQGGWAAATYACGPCLQRSRLEPVSCNHAFRHDQTTAAKATARLTEREAGRLTLGTTGFGGHSGAAAGMSQMCPMATWLRHS